MSTSKSLAATVSNADLIQSALAADYGEKLRAIAAEHACSQHPLFEMLDSIQLTKLQAAHLLRNYDAHASVLRRYLLRAAAIMPEEAVPLVLENVRNEYGNGDYSKNHQDQLRDLAWKSGVSRAVFFEAKVNNGIKAFIKAARLYYCPRKGTHGAGMKNPAIVAGAITATEILAVKEFASMQKAFASLGLAEHHWFHHVTIEQEHRDESVALAKYFEERHDAAKSVEFGLKGVLDANIYLYDGLLAALME